VPHWRITFRIDYFYLRHGRPHGKGKGDNPSDACPPKEDVHDQHSSKVNNMPSSSHD
jgi:hypothetical protein